PGSFLFQEQSHLLYTLIASLVVVNVIMLVLNLPLMGMWVRIQLISYENLFTIILVFTIIGNYSNNGSVLDVGLILVFSVVGYAMRKLGFPLAPIALTLVLGPQFETSLGQSLVLSEGSFTIFFRSYISTGLIIIAVLAMVLPMLKPVTRRLARLKG